MSVISSLFVELRLQSEGFNNDIKDSMRSLNDFEKTVKPSLQISKDLGTAMAATGAAVTGAIGIMVKQAADYGDALRDASIRTGVTVQSMAGLKIAAEQSGASFDDLQTGLKKLAVNADMATTSGSAQQKMFQALGITVKDAHTGAMRPMADILGDVADHFKNTTDKTNETGEAVKLFGKNGAGLIEFLELGKAGLQEFQDKAQRLGLVIGNDVANQADQFKDTLNDLHDAELGMSIVIGNELLPKLTSFAVWMTNSIVGIREFVDNHRALIDVATVAAAVIGSVGTALVTMTYVLPAAKAAMVALDIAMDANPIGLVVTALGALVIGLVYFRNEIAGYALAAFGKWFEGIEKFLEYTQIAAEALGLDGLSGKIGTARDYLTGLSSDMAAASQVVLDGARANDTNTASMEALKQSHKGAPSIFEDESKSLKKLREDGSKANDEYFASLTEFYKNQRQLGQISADDLMNDLLHFEDLRYQGEDHADGNLLELAQKHEKNIQKIKDDGATALHAIDLQMQAQTQADIRQVQQDHEQAQSIIAAADAAFYAKAYGMGAMSADQLRQVQLGAEDLRYRTMVDYHGWTEAEQERHNANLLKIDEDHFKNSLDLSHTYVGDSLLDEATLNAGRAVLRDSDSAQQAATYKEQHDALVIRSKTELDTWKQNAKEQGQLGHDVQHEWESAMDSMAKNVSKSVADMVVSWDFNASSMIDIAKRTATSMLSAMLDGMIRPLTNELAKLGTSLTDSLLGLTQTKNPVTGAVTGAIPGGGGLLGAVGNLIGGGSNPIPGQTAEGLANAGFTAGGTTATGGEASAGLFGGAGAASAAAGIAAAAVGIGGIIYSFLGNAHVSADELVQSFQNPFDSQFGALIGAVNEGIKSGSMSASDLASADQQARSLWEQFSMAVTNWSNEKIQTGFGTPFQVDKNRQKVAQQFYDTENPFVGGWLSWLDANAAAAAAGGQLQSFAVGTPYVERDMLAMIHKGEAIIPADQNTGGMGGVNVTIDARGSNMSEQQWRKIAEYTAECIKNNTRGVGHTVARAMKNQMPSVVTA